MLPKVFRSMLALTIGALLACQLAVAQVPRRTTPRKGLDRKDVLRQESALQTLLYLRNSSLDIENGPDRVRVLVEVADALWLIDRDQARETFKQSFALAMELDKGKSSAQSGSGPTRALQQSVVTRIARRDPALALSLSQSAAELSASTRDGFGELYGVDCAPSEMLVNAAREALSSNTNQALEMAKLASRDGLSQQMRLFLLSLRVKDQAAADSLFRSTLQSAAARRPKQLVEALFHWDYAFQHKVIYLGSVAWFREAPIEYPVSTTLKQTALKFAIDAVLENTQQTYLSSSADSEKPLILERYALVHSLASQILPDVETLMPSAAPALLAALNRLDHELKGQGRTPPGPPEPLPQAPAAQGNIDKLLERARKAPTIEAQDGFYAKAALRLYLIQKYERAVEVAGSISDTTLQQKVMDPIRFDWAGDLIARNKLDSAAQVIQAVGNLEPRVVLLAKLADAYITNKNPSDGLVILREAEVAIGKAKRSPHLGSVILAIGEAHLKLNDRNQAQAAVTLAIELINLSVDGREWDFLGGSSQAVGQLSIQDIQWTNRKDGGLDSVTVVYPRLAGLLDVLRKASEVDFEEALMLARQLKPKGLNHAVQAALCRQTIERIQRNNKPAPQEAVANKVSG
jgi:tetratricopeptide (TPR) repeat protein